MCLKKQKNYAGYKKCYLKRLLKKKKVIKNKNSLYYLYDTNIRVLYYPYKPVEIVNFCSGGANDLLARRTTLPSVALGRFLLRMYRRLVLTIYFMSDGACQDTNADPNQ